MAARRGLGCSRGRPWPAELWLTDVNASPDAPLAVEAVARILDERVAGAGVLSVGAAFDAPDFLKAMGPVLSAQR